MRELTTKYIVSILGESIDDAILQKTKDVIDNIVNHFDKRLRSVGCNVQLDGLQSSAKFDISKEQYGLLSLNQRNEVVYKYAKSFIKIFPKTAKIKDDKNIPLITIIIKPTYPFDMSFVKPLNDASLLTIFLYTGSRFPGNFEMSIKFSMFFSHDNKFKPHQIMKYFRTEALAEEFLATFNSEMCNAIDLTAKAIRLVSL